MEVLLKINIPWLYMFILSWFSLLFEILCQTIHSVHWGISPPQKHHPLFHAKSPLFKFANCPSPPLFRQSPLYIGFSWTPFPLKVRFFSELPKSWVFSSLIASYLLKVTKFLGEGNFIFCCTGSWENYFGLVGWQNNENNAKFQGRCI